MIVTKSFFLLNIFSIVYRSIRFYATSATEEMYIYKTDNVSIYLFTPPKIQPHTGTRERVIILIQTLRDHMEHAIVVSYSGISTRAHIMVFLTYFELFMMIK